MSSASYPSSWPQALDNPALERVYQALWAHGSKWEAGQDWQCVAHDDRRASLGVFEGDSQPVVFNCQAGCTFTDIIRALELRPADVMINKQNGAALSGQQRKPRSATSPERKVSRPRTANTSKPASDHTLQSHLLNDKPTRIRKWTYIDASGAPTVVVRRRDYGCPEHPKAIDQLKVRDGVRPADAPYELYRLKDVRVAAAGHRRVMVVAGEPSVDAALSAGIEENARGHAGYTVTTMRGGEKPGAWLDSYSQTLVGARSVLVVADRDLTGYRHALAVLDSLKAAGVPARAVVSKTERPHDDLVDHLAAGFSAPELVSLPRAELKTRVLELEHKQAQSKSAPVDENIWPSPGNPRAVAAKFLADFEHLRNWRGDYYTYAGSHWRVIPGEEIERALEHALHDALTMKPGKDEGTFDVVPWSLTHARVRDVMHFVERLAYAPKLKDVPFRLDGSSSVLGGVIPMHNGVLEIDGRALSPHTEQLFNVTALPFSYQRSVPAPSRWLAFLKTLWGEDTDSVKLLQEVMGYLVSGRTDFQKIALIVGPPRSGKGTIAQVCQALLGRENVAWPTLDSLADRFGVAPLVGKTAAIVADARFGGRGGQAVVERLLTISGEDSLTVDRKMRDAWTGKIGARFFIMSNEPPNLRENSGALANRMLHLRLTQSFLGREDHSLVADLLSDESLAGVFNWALDGLDRLLATSYFTVPKASAAAERELIRLASPITAFVEDECILDPDGVVTKDEMYLAWSEYASDNNTSHVSSKDVFGRDLITAFPLLRAVQLRKVSQPGRRDPAKGNFRSWCYRGIRLKRGRR